MLSRDRFSKCALNLSPHAGMESTAETAEGQDSLVADTLLLENSGKADVLI